ncbi:MAG: metallophosphoesterase [Pirellulales bacterium]|nr:metallophosphoesterase [Pirellulales bacterium]
MNKYRFFQVVCLLAGWLAASSLMAAVPTIQPGSWTLAILPDTQYYVNYNNGIFEAQTQFLVTYKSALNLKYVLHEGDVTQSNTTGQWSIASNAMSTLEGAGIPFTLLPGNHDYYNNAYNRSSFLSTYFPTTRLDDQPTYGGVYSAEPTLTNNSYSIFSAGGIDWLVIGMEFGPRNGVVDWADGLMKANPDRKVMIVTHSYLDYDGTIMDHNNPTQEGNPHEYGIDSLPGGVNDGLEMWDALKDNPNLLFVFNGHSTNPAYPRPTDPYGAGGYLTGTADDGHTVHQLIANYQAMASDNGYLRLLEFQTDGQVHVRTYSPNKDLSLTAPNHDFVITIPEPSTWLLIFLAGLGVVIYGRRSR